MAYTQEVGRNFWYAFDGATQRSPAFGAIYLSAGARDSQKIYFNTRVAGTFPAAFEASFAPRKADWIQIADVQTTTINDYLGTDWDDIRLAFEDFGQGVLFDPRSLPPRDPIHMMDGETSEEVIGYHRWHASIRAIQLLGIGDASWWEKLDTILGLAWAAQSLNTPVQQTTPNAPLPTADLDELRAAWLPLTPAERDAQFDLPAGQYWGHHPEPKRPVLGVA